eukprot:scaffold14111_cov31-Prasinocladus_malaysianus.AAC.1
MGAQVIASPIYHTGIGRHSGCRALSRRPHAQREVGHRRAGGGLPLRVGPGNAHGSPGGILCRRKA